MIDTDLVDMQDVVDVGVDALKNLRIYDFDIESAEISLPADCVVHWKNASLINDVVFCDVEAKRSVGQSPANAYLNVGQTILGVINWLLVALVATDTTGNEQEPMICKTSFSFQIA